MTEEITAALIGNPNTGKSTIFNLLTGSSQEVGNWPGKTIEKKSGTMDHEDATIDIIDLPGTYSMSALSAEEVVARDFIASGKADVVVDIVDASNLERNLYLAVQLIEMGANVVIALNMMDTAKSKGFDIDPTELSRLLGIPVVPMVARAGKGKEKLVKTIIESAKEPPSPAKIDYGPELEDGISEISSHIEKHAPELAKKYDPRYLAVRLIEHDSQLIEKIKKADSDIINELDEVVDHTSQIHGEDADIEVADRRYAFINGIVRKAIRRTPLGRISSTDKIDCIMTNPFLGIPLFLIIMYLMYQLVFLAGDPFVTAIGQSIEWLASISDDALMSHGAPEWLRGLIVSGMIQGIGNVLVFLPNIALLFIAIAILEDSGYLARAAFVMDRVMSLIGLHGKSFIPLVVAFGCTVPSIMSTRILDRGNDRLITMLCSTFIPCSARTVVFVFIAGAFFDPQAAGQVVWSLFIISFLVVMGAGWLMRRFLFRGSRAPFVIELPPYQVPTLQGVLVHSWHRTREFLSKAGTFIFAVAVIIWALAYFPEDAAYGGPGSLIGIIGSFIEPLFAPLGFGLEGSIAILFGLFAKEVVISTFGVLYGAAVEGTLAEAISQAWDPLSAYAFMVFILLYTPCLASITTIYNETKSLKIAMFSVLFTLLVAWSAAFLVKTAGRMLLG
jgi:ferrous iron transport protein B